MDKILITGGLGQVGSYIAENLMENNEVVLLDNMSSFTWKKVPSDIEVIKKDVLDVDIMDIVDGCDVVIHLAAQISVGKSMENPMFDAQNNLIGTLNMLEAARYADVNRFIYFSSAAVYGNTEYLPVDELHPLNPLSPYGASKLSGEIYSKMYHRQFGLPVVCLRPFNIYSPRQDSSNPYSGVISIFIEKVKNNEYLPIFGSGSQTRDFVSVHDVVDMVLLAMEQDSAIGGVFNVGTGQKISVQKLAEMILNIHDNGGGIEYLPSRMGDIMDSYADISKAKSIGYVPKISIEMGLRKFLE
ncbi:MAG: NAD-dependent epimerase/dehydratase family protein [Methanosarcinaceae archaeon]|nr:NAD-dependent epimerase/dehydratase family protein [Methanosarcinaceae archaeon]